MGHIDPWPNGINEIHEADNVCHENNLTNYPNPFGSITTLRYELKKSTHLKLSIYDMSGRLVKILIDSEQPKGSHELIVNMNEYKSGMYYCKLITDYSVTGNKMLLMK